MCSIHFKAIRDTLGSGKKDITVPPTDPRPQHNLSSEKEGNGQTLASPNWLHRCRLHRRLEWQKVNIGVGIQIQQLTNLMGLKEARACHQVLNGIWTCCWLIHLCRESGWFILAETSGITSSLSPYSPITSPLFYTLRMISVTLAWNTSTLTTITHVIKLQMGILSSIIFPHMKMLLTSSPSLYHHANMYNSSTLSELNMHEGKGCVVIK